MNNEADTSEQIRTQSLQNPIEEAAQRIRDGQSTPEDQALLAGFEMGANEAIKSASASIEPIPARDDLLGATNRRIQQLNDPQQLDDIITTEKMWGNDYDTTARETELKGHEDMARYLKGRDFKDDKGRVHDATSGEFIQESQANERSIEQDTTAYEDMPLVGLLKKWADAEFHNDRTMSSDIQDEIQSRLENDSNATEEDKAKIIDDLNDRMLRIKNSMQETAEAIPETVSTDPSTQVSSPEADSQATDDQFAEIPEKLLESIEAQLGEKQNDFKAAALEYAIAKLGSEKIFAGKDRKTELEKAGRKLAAAHEACMLANDAVVERSRQYDDEYFDGLEEDLQAILEDIEKSVADREQLATEEMTDETRLKIDEITKQIDDFYKERDEAQEEIDYVKADRAEIEYQKQAMRLQSLTELSKTVENQMLAERMKAHPKLTKINDWLAKHSKTRLAVGLGLTAAGVVGAATFNAPLVGLSMAGKGILRGYGSYNASRAVGEMIANHQLKPDEIKDIDDFLEGSRKQSTARRLSKRAGVGVATALAAVPAITRLIESGNHVSSITKPIKPPSTTTTTTPPVSPPTGGLPRLIPVDGNTLPWTYGMDVLHTNISDPDILSKLTNNADGIRFIGNGLGAGHGAIESVTIPGQGTFSDVGHINAAISYVLGKG